MGVHSYSFDAENRISAVMDQGVTYSYGPDGQRVATSSGGAVEAEYLYDMAGELVTTVDGAGQMVRSVLRADGEHWGDYIGAAGPGGAKSEFRLVNQVGTLVGNGDAAGNFVEVCLSGQFGDGQICNPSYDYTETHFTDKLRDAETDNDYFGARYFSSTLGRFLSPDWSASPEAVPYADLMNPQSLNLYSYVRKNPLSRVDKDGHQEAIPTPLGPLPLFFPQQQITRQQAGQMASDIRDFVSTLGQVISEDAARVGGAASAIGQALTAGNGQSEANAPVPTSSPTPNFVVTPGGDAIPIPTDAKGPSPVVSDSGNVTGSQYTGGSGGGPGFDSKVTGVRVMNPVPARRNAPARPDGYVSYGNKTGQTVNPATGRTVPNADPSAHIDLKPRSNP